MATDSARPFDSTMTAPDPSGNARKVSRDDVVWYHCEGNVWWPGVVTHYASQLDERYLMRFRVRLSTAGCLSLEAPLDGEGHYSETKIFPTISPVGLRDTFTFTFSWSVSS